MLELVATKVYKKSVDTRIGASLDNDARGHLILSKIDPDGLFSTSKLKVGYRIIQVNQIQCQDMPYQEAIHFIKNVKGSLMVMADRAGLVTAEAVKEFRNSPVGITVARYGDDVFVKEMEDGSIFADTDLMAGMRLVSINNQLVKFAHDAHETLLNAVGKITVVAEASPENTLPQLHTSETSMESQEAVVRSLQYHETRDQPEEESNDTLVVEAIKISMNSRVGIKVVDCENGVFVEEISDDGLLKDSGLQGLRLVCVNDHPVASARQAIEYCREVVGRLSIVADTATLPARRLRPESMMMNLHKPSTVVYEVIKETVDTRIGVKVADHENGVFFHAIYNYGLLAQSTLLGMRLLTINNYRIETAKQAVGIFKVAEGLLSIIADDAIPGIATPSRSEQWLVPLDNTEKNGVITVTVMKNFIETKVGIKVVGHEGEVFIKDVNESGLLANTYLEPGQRIVSINNHHIEDPRQAVAIFKEALGSLTIVAEDVPHETLLQATSTIQPPPFTLTLHRKSLMVNGSLSNMQVFKNDVQVGIIMNSGPKSTLVVDGLVGDVITIRFVANPGLMFRVVKAGTLTMRVKLCTWKGLRVQPCVSDNPDVNDGAFDHWGQPWNPVARTLFYMAMAGNWY